MELLQIATLVIFLLVYALSTTRRIHRAAVALVGAVGMAALWGLPALNGYVIPEVLLVTAGLMVLAGFVKRSGIASWLALKAAKIGRGRPNRILILMGMVTYLIGALLGPIPAVALVVPVALLLASELDVSPLPFVVVLSWTSLLGGATTLTAQPGNLWIGAALDLDGSMWIKTMLPLTLAALVATLATGSLVFAKRLRVTNERRARVLEYDEAQSVSDKPLLWKTLTVLVLVVAGLVVGPWLGLAPSVVTLAGAVLLWVWDPARAGDRFLGDLEGGTLVFFGSLMAVVGAFAATGLPQSWVVAPLPPLVVLGLSALLGAAVDHGAAAGALLPFLQAMGPGAINSWPFLILGTTVGAGATILGSVSNAAALSLAGQGPRKLNWRDFSRYGLLLAVVNLIVISVLSLVLAS